MRKLLDIPSQRIVQILEILTQSDDWLSIGKLSDMLNVSRRTAGEDVSALRKRWGQALDIEVSPQEGVRMHNRSTAVLGAVYIDIFNDSIALKWLEAIFFYPGKGIEFYEEKLFVSRSTLVRLLPKINHFLAEKGLNIQSRGNEYQIFADNEQYLRQFYAGFIIELHGFDLTKYQIEFDLGVLRNIIVRIIEKSLSPDDSAFILNDDVFLPYHMIVYLLSLIRENQGYHMDSTHCLDGEIHAQELRYIRSRFPEINARNLRAIHEFIVIQNAHWDSAKEQTDVESETNAFLQRLFKTVNVCPTETQMQQLRLIMKSLYFLAKFRPHETSCLFDRSRYFLLSVQKTNPALCKLFDENMRILSDNIGFDLASITKDILYWVCLTAPEICHYSKPKTILIVSDIGITHARFLAARISDLFNKGEAADLTIDTAVCFDLPASAAKNGYDLIISTAPNLPVKNINIVLVNDYPTRENLCDI